MPWKTGGHKGISQHGQGWIQDFCRVVSTSAEGARHLGGSGGMPSPEKLEISKAWDTISCNFLCILAGNGAG